MTELFKECIQPILADEYAQLTKRIAELEANLAEYQEAADKILLWWNTDYSPSLVDNILNNLEWVEGVADLVRLKKNREEEK